jgi:hypothetical protein
MAGDRRFSQDPHASVSMSPWAGHLADGLKSFLDHYRLGASANPPFHPSLSWDQ